MEYKDLKPEQVFYWFKEISKIPRESGNEEGISDFLVDFAKKRNLEVSQDEVLNVLIKKQASKGKENSPVVMLQGHMDMVCVKDASSKHDFTKDPIELVVEGDWLRANKTTLGADDGIAVAYALAILDDDKLSHGPLEALITTGEETSMVGVNNLDTSKIKAKYLLNLDSEEEGIITVGCAGGMDIEFSFEKKYQENKGEFLEISLEGFEGGHSGMEIDKYRANAIKQLTRLVNALGEFQIGKIEGGVKRNAIPTSAKAIISVKDRNSAKNILEEVKAEILHEFKNTDPNGSISIKDSEFEGKVLDEELSKNIISALFVTHDGVYKKYQGNLVTSSNLGLLEEDDTSIKAVVLARSEITSDKRYRRDIIKKTVEAFGAKVVCKNEYPGWEREESILLDDAGLLWEKLFGKKAEILTTHGGLECGLLKEDLKETDMISFGPTIEGAHSPRERVSISSVEKNYKYLIELLKVLS